MFQSIDDVAERLEGERHFVDRDLATAIYLAWRLKKPLLLEGAHGIGKSQLAHAMAHVLSTPIYSLMCYPGITRDAALYEWNYPKQLVRMHATSVDGRVPPEVEREVFGEDYLVKRPILSAIEHDGPVPPVLLVERVERAGEEFQSLLAEVLTSWRIEIPELGKVEAKEPPLVVLTSTNVRSVIEPLQRRCLYHWMDYPDFGREVEIVTAAVPGAAAALVRQVCNIVGILRREPLVRPPGVIETVDWTRALTLLRRTTVDADVLDQTIGCLFKDSHDIEHVRTLHLQGLLGRGVDAVG